MAASYLQFEQFPKNAIEGFQHTFVITARDSAGAIDTGYAGLVSFTSTDPTIKISPLFPASPVALVSGSKSFTVTLSTAGAQSVIVSDGTLPNATATTIVAVQPPGWGFDDKGIFPYGDAASGIGAALKNALAVSTKEVDITVTNLVQDNSPFLAGDALNPSTWTVQRLDSNVFLHVVSVTQQSTYTYRLLCLEDFGPVAVTHRVSSSVLKDVTGALIVTPRNASFLGLLDETKTSVTKKLASHSSSVRDFSNTQIPTSEAYAGVLKLTTAGDYQLESGAPLLKKLIYRRLMSTPGDFFHLPGYGIGIRNKEPIPASNLGNLKTKIEQQVLREPEVEAVKASLTLDSNGVLTVTVKARMRKTGESIEIGFNPNNPGIAA